MTAARWSEVERLFDAALALPQAQRADFLARSCAGDAGLAAEVSSLLQASEAAGEFLEPRDEPSAPRPSVRPTLATGTVVGAWSVDSLIGRGGMSEVYLAQRADGQYAQRAALKLLNAELGQKSRYLLEERQILARLEHPAITRLIDGGMTADGRPWLVMEYIDGRGIVEHCNAVRATLEQRLSIFVQVCDAVAYAHRHLIVHRDLKPENILVAADGSVHLLDFGVAHLLDAALPEAAQHTVHLTPGYAAPEQLDGSAVTTATDVYSLGVILYQLLCGRPPLDIARLPMTLALQRILRDAPRLPSEAARDGAAPVSAAALAGDLDAIAVKALRKEPEHRYASAAELKADVERHLRHEPLAARGYDLRYVLGRFVRRHRVAVGLASAATLALLLGLSASLWFYADARSARERAEAEAAAAQAINDFLIRDLLAGIQLEKRPTRDVSLLELLDDAARETDRRFAGQPETAARVHQSIGESYFNLSKYALAREQHGKALQLFSQLLGRGSVPALAEIARLATIEGMLGNADGAMALYREAIAGYSQGGAIDLMRVAQLRVEAADLLNGRGDFQGAVDQFRALVESPAMKSLSAEDRLDAGARYAGALFWLGDYEAAERQHREVLEGRIRQLGPEHLATAVSHLFLGGVLIERARLDDAAREMEAGLAGVRRWVGPDDAFLAVGEAALGRLRMLQGRHGEAEALLQDALRIRRGVFGAGNSLTAWTEHQLAENLRAQGRLAESAAVMRRALPVAEAADGAANPWTVRQRLILIGVLREQGDLAGARAEFAKIPPDALARLPATHPFRTLLEREKRQLAV